MKVSNNKDDIIITSSLGSCLGVTLYDPASCVGGMLHALLPQSNMNPERANGNPCMFVDSGFEALLAVILKMGANKKRLICKVAGGGTFLDQKGVFKTGERNFTILRKVLWKNNILIKSQEVGGSIPRTLILRLHDGQTSIRSRGVEVPF
ncbi:MAG: chemotaxis protein CheD [Candidatus Omnitrophota bacterium]